MRRPRMKVNRPIFPDFPFTWNPHPKAAHLMHGREAMRVKLMRPCLCLAWLCLSSVRFSEFKFSGKRPLDLAFGEEVPILFLILIGQICGILAVRAI